jgi:hypothetical protein
MELVFDTPSSSPYKQKVTLYDWDRKLTCARGFVQTIPVGFCTKQLVIIIFDIKEVSSLVTMYSLV